MGIVVTSNFDMNSALPLDSRQSVADTTARDAIPAGTRWEGMIVYVESDLTNYQLVGGITNGDWQELSGAGGAGGINFILNPNAEENPATTGWVTFDDGAVTVPVDGTGGSPTALTLTDAITNASTPLAGENSFVLSKGIGTDGQGEGISYDFTIDPAYKARVLTVKFEYRWETAGTAGSPGVDGTLVVYLYDVTNSRLIQPSNYKLLSNSITISDQFQAEFQTSSDSTSYRLIIMSGVTTTSGWSILLSRITVSPNEYVFGSPVSDWTSYTPTPTNFTLTSSNLQWRRVGSNVEIRGRMVINTVSAGEARLSLPSGLTSASSITTLETVGNYARNSNGAETGWVLIEPSISYLTFGIQFVSGNGITKANANAIWVGTNIISFEARVPIQGWSSSVQMADSTSTRVVAASYYVNSGVSTTSSNPINYDTRNFDTHNAVTTGAGTWKFTAPVSGLYSVTGRATHAAGSADYYLFKNGTAYQAIMSANAGVTAIGGGGIVSLNVGDYIEIRPSTTVTPSGISGSIQLSHINIQRISGPAQIASSETVAASYWVSAATFAASTTIPVNFDSREYDTHNAVTTSATAWRFTAPIGGLYEVKGVFDVSAATWLRIYKNGTFYKNAGYEPGTQASAISANLMLNAGEFIDFRPNTALNFGGGALANDGTSTIAITRIGNRG